jgi:hypothetical protein
MCATQPAINDLAALDAAISGFDRVDLLSAVAGLQAAQTATRMPVVNPSAVDQTRSHRFCQNSPMYNAPFAVKNTR